MAVLRNTYLVENWLDGADGGREVRVCQASLAAHHGSSTRLRPRLDIINHCSSEEKAVNMVFW